MNIDNLPRINPEKIYSTYDIADRWSLYSPFFISFTKLEFHEAVDKTNEILRSFIDSGEIVDAKKMHDEAGEYYQLSGGSLIKLENKAFDVASSIEMDIAYTHSTYYLEVMRQAIREFMSDARDHKKEIVVDRIKEIGDELGGIVSSNVAKAIFTIIKRDSHDPKKRV